MLIVDVSYQPQVGTMHLIVRLHADYDPNDGSACVNRPTQVFTGLVWTPGAQPKYPNPDISGLTKMSCLYDSRRRKSLKKKRERFLGGYTTGDIGRARTDLFCYRQSK